MDQQDPWAEQAVRDDLAGALPVDYAAFHSQHHRAYLRYAYLQLGSRERAAQTVEDVFTHLLRVWGNVLRQPSAEAYAWAALKEAVIRRLEALDRPVALVETAAFAALRESSRTRLELLESRLGLYTAIAKLPERHYDVIVLVFVLGYPQQKAAQMMGVSYATVRSHLRGARRRLARELGFAWPPGDSPGEPSGESTAEEMGK
ncbi:RNA polymerase sigma factor [Streptomyces sp. SAJ15]|uniref:RNA polymerase sigma factor n=1 Tax=Streptomyces sp. SAJ15 TaxID=2011095 RepID=UPI001186023C|nr:sigma-70 family RNA polymerase sigma factor [Streptomyces sp. SAJ15]TVL89373.1 RNA polymerase subunit sigma [Streptomyces sp. SAJ15]